MPKKILPAVLIAVAGLAVAVVRAMRGFAPMRNVCVTGPRAEGLWAIRDGNVAGYVISDGHTSIAIDAGMRRDRFARALATLPVDPDTVDAVYLTHSDRDHVGALDLYSRARVILPEAEVPVATGAAPRRMFFFSMRARHGFGRPYSTIADGETATHGSITVRAILTPGHTPGSTSYLVNGRWLFTGDLLMLRNGVAEVTWPAMNNDSDQSVASIRRLASGMQGLLDGVELLVTAHTGSAADYHAAMARFREDGPGSSK